MFKDLNTEKASVLNFSFTSQKQQKGPRYSKNTHTFNWVEIHMSSLVGDIVFSSQMEMPKV